MNTAFWGMRAPSLTGKLVPARRYLPPTDHRKEISHA
jgi:hypothetical protein